MKKIISLLSAFAIICGTALCYSEPVKAFEAATMEEYNQQVKEQKQSAFPDPDASYSVAEINSLVYHLYDEYAVLAECKDREITEVVIPDEINGLPVIGSVDSPFGFCRNLTSITLPDSFEHINWFNLINTCSVWLGSDEEPVPSVSEIVVSETNPYYTVSDGLLYSKDMKTLVGCPPAMGIKELKVSEKTETIGDYAFVACMGLEKAIIPSNIEHINNNAFTACHDLVYAELPENIHSISGDMFSFCTSLSEVRFRGIIETIGYGAFYECNSLKDFIIPETVTYIGANAFTNSGCVNNEQGIHYVQNWVVGSDEDITEAVITDDTVGIAEMSFTSRSNLVFMNIPTSVRYIGDVVFLGINYNPAVIYYGCEYINEKTITASKMAADIYILNPECRIFDSEKTIPANYKLLAQNNNCTDVSYDPANKYITGDIVIHGYADSTAQAYAEKYNRKFESIAENTVSGDVNADSEFNIADVVCFQKWLLNASDTEISNLSAADFATDNKLDVFDLIIMKKKLIENGSASHNEEKSIIQGLKNGMTSGEVFEVTGMDYIEKSEGLRNTVTYYYPVNAGEAFGTSLDGMMFVEFDTETDKLVNYGYHLGRKGNSESLVFPYSKQELKEAYDTVMNVLTEWYGEGQKGSLSDPEEEYIWELSDGQLWAVYGVNLWSDKEPEQYEKGINEVIISCSH